MFVFKRFRKGRSIMEVVYSGNGSTNKRKEVNSNEEKSTS